MSTEDEDRDAILRRRNRLIALALGGMSTLGCAEGGDRTAPTGRAETAEVTEVAEAMSPLPVDPASAPAEEDTVADQAPLGDDEHDEDEPDSAEIAHAEARKRRVLTPPRPCLSVLRPPSPPPVVCLSPMMPEDFE